MNKMTVVKLDPQRQEIWRYSGEVLARSANAVLIEAHFNRDDMEFHGMSLKRSDRFVEVYDRLRWYNVFEIYNRDDGALKGWYCNVTLPAEIEAEEIRYVDLALDLLVFTDGRQLVLDEDEFAELELDEATLVHARQALEELSALFHPGFTLAGFFAAL
jgi:uncharacterized protein